MEHNAIKWICPVCKIETSIQPEKKCAVCNNCKKARLQSWKQCECGKWFRPSHLKAKYCSFECKVKYVKPTAKRGKRYPDLIPWNKKERIIKTCPVCGKDFATIRDKAVYCSKECWSHRATVVKKCLQCGNEFKSYKSMNAKYCCKECQNKAARSRTGDKSPAWRGGRTKEAKLRRCNIEYKEWRMAVFKRDDFTCQICGKHGSYLEAHHIKEVCNYPELIYDVDNGLTLCHECHKTTDNYANGAKKQAISAI